MKGRLQLSRPRHTSLWQNWKTPWAFPRIQYAQPGGPVMFLHCRESWLPPAKFFGYHVCPTCKWAAAWRTMFPKQTLIGCMIRQWGFWGLLMWKVKLQCEGNHMTLQAHRNHGQQQLFQQGARTHSTAGLWWHSSCAGLQGQVCPELSSGTWSESSFGKSLNCRSGLLQKVSTN